MSMLPAFISSDIAQQSCLKSASKQFLLVKLVKHMLHLTWHGLCHPARAQPTSDALSGCGADLAPRLKPVLAWRG